MAKKWIMLFIISFMMVLVSTAYAASKMVVVINPADGKVEQVYDASSIAVQGNKITIEGVNASKEAANAKTFKIKKKDGSRVDHKVVSIPDHTVIHTKDSPGCVTYTYGGYSYTVCD